MLEAIRIINNSENPSALGSDIELDISSLLNLLPREERQEEVKQVRAFCLMYLVFFFISPASFLLSYFWLKDIKVSLSIRELFRNPKAMETGRHKEWIDGIDSSWAATGKQYRMLACLEGQSAAASRYCRVCLPPKDMYCDFIWVMLSWALARNVLWSVEF